METRAALQQRQARSIHFTKLSDLEKNANRTVNVFGIVKFFKGPYKGRGKDFCMCLSLVDDSFQSTEQTFICNIFSPHEDQLPLVTKVGDFIRLENVQVSKFRGELKGKGTSTLSWVTFDGLLCDFLTPLSSKIPHYTPSEQDKQKLEDLRAWASSYDSIRPQFFLKTVSQISQETVFFNVACQVISVCQASTNSCRVLTVWDGTFPICQSHSLEKLLTDTLEVSTSLKGLSNGMTIDVFLYDEHACGEAKELKPGDFVLMNNVHVLPEKVSEECTTVRPIFAFVIHKGRVNGRGVSKLQQDSHLAKTLQEQIDCFILTTQGDSFSEISQTDSQRHGDQGQVAEETRAFQTSCTITDFPLVPFTNIAAIKSCAQVPNKFRSRAKAVAFFPDNVKNFVQPRCHGCKIMSCAAGENARKTKWSYSHNRYIDSESIGSSESDDTEDGSGIQQETPQPNVCPVCDQSMGLAYVFSLLLKDATGFLLVMLVNDDVNHFFPELPTPEEFQESEGTQKSVHDSLVSITGGHTNDLIDLTMDSQVFEKSPWIEFCVKSYSVEGQGVMYQMFGTSLV